MSNAFNRKVIRGDLVVPGDLGQLRKGVGPKRLTDIPSSQFGQSIQMRKAAAANSTGFIPTSIGVPKAAFRLDDVGVPDVWTLTIAPKQAGVSGATVSDFTAIIIRATFGCGGSDQVIEFNALQGASVSGPASGMVIEAVIDDYSLIYNVSPQSYSIAYTIAPGCNLSRYTAQRWFSVSLEAGVISSPIVVPNFARSVFLMPQNPATAAALFNAANSVQFYGGAVLVSHIPANQFGYQILNKVAVPNFGQALVYDNTAGASALQFWVGFDVAF